MTFVAVTGQPGAGKSTLAALLAKRLQMSLLAKDTVKEALAMLEDPERITLSRSQDLGRLSFEVIFALASDSGGAVLEAPWDPALAGRRLAELQHRGCGSRLGPSPELGWLGRDVVRLRF